MFRVLGLRGLGFRGSGVWGFSVGFRAPLLPIQSSYYMGSSLH